MKKAAVATLALISLLLGACRSEEADKPSIPEAEGSGRKINVTARSSDTPTTDSDSIVTTGSQTADVTTTSTI